MSDIGRNSSIDASQHQLLLAMDRTLLAAERTYAAWVRTGLGALASGVGIKALLAPLLPVWLVSLIGSFLIAFSAFCFGAAVWRELTPGFSTLADVKRLPTGLLLAVNGLLIVADVATLIGMWVPRA